MIAHLPSGPEYSASVYLDEEKRDGYPCAYRKRGCTAESSWRYSIGAGLTHPGGEAYLYACQAHDTDVRKHAENIVRFIMMRMGGRDTDPYRKTHDPIDM